MRLQALHKLLIFFQQQKEVHHSAIGNSDIKKQRFHNLDKILMIKAMPNVHIHVCVSISVTVSVSVNINISVRVTVCVHVCVYLCMCICMFISCAKILSRRRAHRRIQSHVGRAHHRIQSCRDVGGTSEDLTSWMVGGMGGVHTR